MKSRFWFLAALALLVTFSISMTAFAAVPTVKLPQAMNAPTLLSTRSVVMSDLPQMTAQEARSVVAVPRPRTPGFSAAQLQVIRQQNVAAQLGAPAGNMTPRSGLTPLASKNFLGTDVRCSFLTPSDMGIAAGGTHVVQAVNSCLQISTKAGALVSRVTLQAFTGCAGCFLFDPRLTYDVAKNRYVMVIDSFQNNQATIFIAVTASSNPTLGWFIFAFNFDPGTGDLADFPTLGLDRQGIYIGFNNFKANKTFNNQLWLVNKAQAYAGAVPTVLAFQGFTLCTSLGCEPVDTLQPVTVSGKSDQPRTEYMVNSISGTANLFNCGSLAAPCNGMVIWSITDPFGSLTLGGVLVGTPVSYAFPVNANQPGGAGTIDTNDLRFSGNVQYQGGNLYPTLTRAIGGPENSTLTFQVHPFVDSATRAHVVGAAFGQTLAYGDFGGVGTNGSAYFGTVQPDTDGDLLMVFAFSDDNNFPGVAYITHRTSEGDGKFNYGGAGIFLRTGQAFYNEARWGDYSGTAIEYATSDTQNNWWFSGMFSTNFPGVINNTWATGIGKDAYTTFTQN